MPSNRKSCLHFARDTRGNIAPTFALLAVPLLAFAGGAIDFATAMSVRSKMQHALDAATIAAMNDYRNNGNADKAENLLKKLLAAELAPQGLSPHKDGKSKPNEYVLTGAKIDVATGSLAPQLSATVPTSLLKIVQFNSIDVSVGSGTSLSGRKIDVGIMLDVTGSMCDNNRAPCSSGQKLDALKRAVKHFLGIVLSTGGDTSKVAIVPFSSAVNVGSFVKAATGQTSDRRTETVRCEDRDGRNGGRDGGRNGGRDCTQTYYLTQCVTERDGTGRRNNDLPGKGKYFTPVWSDRSSSDCTPNNANRIQPLTSNLKTLEDRLDALTAEGGTAGHLGAQWTWASISHSWAGFWGAEHAPRAPAGDIKKVAILMTDGDMTLHNLESGPNCRGSAVQGKDCVESRQDFLAICSAMKSEGIVVYTIGYAPFGQGISSIGKQMLEDCASPGKAFLPYSEEAMERDFQNIGKDVAGSIVITH